jgi:four helix bundle protein
MDNTHKTFTKLDAWSKAHQLILKVYGLVDKFPDKEKFVLSSQILRAAISITSNIAEGYGRNSYKEKVQFYYISRGSLIEMQNQLLLAKDLKYIKTDDFQVLAEQSVEVLKLINGLIRSSKNKINL